MKSKPVALSFPLTELKRIIAKHILFKDYRIIDVVVAGILANLFKSDPLWLLLVAPPSGGKTELLRSLDGLPFTYFLSTLTPQTLISGKKTKSGGSCSLLPRLNNKILVLKDFTSVLSMKYEQRTEILAQLREVADGRLTKGFGTGETFDWEGHVGLIGAVTPVYDTFHSVIAMMGDRFLLWRSGSEEELHPGITAIDRVGGETVMRDEMRQAVSDFIEQFKKFKPSKLSVSEEIKKVIVTMALVAGKLRCPVDREPHTKVVTYDPQPEGAPRLSKQLYQLGVALAVAHGNETIGPSELEILAKVTFDLATSRRARIVRYLWKNLCWQSFGTWATTADVALALDTPTNTAKYALEDMMILGICRRDLRGVDENAGYRWQLSERITEQISFSDLLPEPQTAKQELG